MFPLSYFVNWWATLYTNTYFCYDNWRNKDVWMNEWILVHWKLCHLLVFHLTHCKVIPKKYPVLNFIQFFLFSFFYETVIKVMLVEQPVSRQISPLIKLKVAQNGNILIQNSGKLANFVHVLVQNLYNIIYSFNILFF